MAVKTVEPQLNEAARARIDNFVDSAFAFAVTLLVISSGEPPADLDALKRALLRVPGFAAGFALIAMFWWSHRSYSRVRPEGAVSLLFSLALVFVVLVYVYPLRLFSDMLVSVLTGDAWAGKGPVQNMTTMRDLYIIYGAGFTALALLFLLAFTHAGAMAKRAGDLIARAYAREHAAIWMVLASAGALSVGLATTAPFDTAISAALPGLAYALIPVGIGIVSIAQALGRRTV